MPADGVVDLVGDAGPHALLVGLFVMNPVESHVTAIYRKLGLGSRDAALAAWHAVSGT